MQVGPSKIVIRPKKVVLFPEIGLVKNCSSLIRPHNGMCIRIYIFCFYHKKHIHRQKVKESERKRKTKETIKEKEKENVVAANNICGKSNGIQ